MFEEASSKMHCIGRFSSNHKNDRKAYNAQLYVRDGHSSLTVGSVVSGVSWSHNLWRPAENCYEPPRVDKLMSNILLITSKDYHFSWCTDSSGNNILPTPKRESLEWMIDPVSKFFKTEELVLDTCTGTLRTAKPCSQLSENRPVYWTRKGLRVFRMSFVAGCSIREAGFETGLRHDWESGKN